MTVRYVPTEKKPWGVFWKANLKNGERKRCSKYFATEGEATTFKAAHEAIAATLPPPPPRLKSVLPTTAAGPMGAATAPRGSLTLRAFAVDWLTAHVARRRPASRRGYESILETHVYETLGAIRLSPETFGTQHVVAMLSTRAAAGVEWGTQKAIIRVVSSMLSWAVRYNHLDKNPCAKLVKELKDSSSSTFDEPEPNPLNTVQLDAFLRWLQTGRLPGKPADYPVDGPRLRGGQLRTEGYPEWYPYFLTLARTGMRRGEAAALKWATTYLDRTPARARIERSYSPDARRAALEAGAKTSDGDLAPKSGKAREIDVAPRLADVLRDEARRRRAAALARGRAVSPYVFVTPRGTRILSDSSTAERIFLRFMTVMPPHLGCHEGCTEAHAAHTIHDLRDTFATLHLMQNPGKLGWVSWMLGHKHVSTTLNRYTKFVPQLVGGQHQTFAGDLDAPTAQAKVDALTAAAQGPGAGEK